MELNGIKREKMLIPFIFALGKWLFINILTAGAWTGVPASKWDLFSSFVPPGLCGFLNSLPQRPARSVTNEFIITWILVDVAIFTISPPSPGFLFGSGFFRNFITKSVRFCPTSFGPTPLHYFFVFWRTAFTFVIPTSPGNQNMFIISANILTKMKSDWFSYQVDAGNLRIGKQKPSSF